MRKLLLIPVALMASIAKAYAFVPLICDLCAIGVVAGLAVTRALGIDDSVMGVWVGAVTLGVIDMTNQWLAKKKWSFFGSPLLVLVVVVGFMVYSLKLFKIVLSPESFVFVIGGQSVDRVLFGAVIGALLLALSGVLYYYLKKGNGGHAHFPYEKVVLPLSFLTLASVTLHILTYYGYFG